MTKQRLDELRHSCAHLLAAAVVKLYPKAKLTIGPPIENGFYYDIDFGDEKISEADLAKIEEEMRQMIKKWIRFEKKVRSKKQALSFYKDNEYKRELVEEFAQRGEEISFYQAGDFEDMCRGGHIENPKKQLKHFKLLSIAGAYWRGNEKNKMLTRIYGTCFPTKEELDKYLWLLEEAKKRDHRKLGKQLDLFVISEDIGKGLPLLTPKGAIIRKQILDYEYQLEVENNFLHVVTPHIARTEIYKKTGHFQHYREFMYSPFGIEGEEYVLKPMNCPHHYMIYASRPRSYKELPIRLAEPGTCYRFEKTGELGGLLRVRALTIDDSHILMTEEQIDEEFTLCINLVEKMFKAFNLTDFYVRLSLADPADSIKYIADKKTWERAGEKLKEIVKKNRLNYKIAAGEASFYGPKLDFMVSDSLNRQWQMSTLQLDLFMGKRLGLVYTDKKGKKRHPVILHRGLTGSIERTLAILIEHYAGAFPLWLSPVQLKILPISASVKNYAQKIFATLVSEGFRVEIDLENKTIGAKIRESTLQKIPYLVIIGKSESESYRPNKDFKVSLRTREGKDLRMVSLESFINKLKSQIEKFQ